MHGTVIALMMGTVIIPETLVIFNQLTQLIAQEGQLALYIISYSEKYHTTGDYRKHMQMPVMS
jgi:hypothetical protein